MIFSRIGRSLSRSSRAKEYLRGDAKLGTLLGATRTNVHSQGTELGLGFFRGYVAHARARGKGILSSLPDFNCVPANPKIHYRLFFSERSKKNKESETNRDDHGNVNFFPFKQPFISSLVMALITVAWFYRPEGQQINFQEFKYELLEPRLVDHIVVSINKSIARIYVRNTPRNQTDSEVVEGTLPAKGTGGQYKFYFNIGSVKSFEEKLKAAQEELGLEPHDYVPVTYSFEEDWEQELMRYCLTGIALFSGTLLLLLGLYMIT
ncbi:ATP-dependent zinc metalloprotease FTSH 3, mitochondrial-like isoform X1 [Arachis stenosperma]|uniref:ATP-dependent zinc metalloprotease FTSH 3, mitochondrial-like isoform X1 n=1 Tax=Arachis stenosperma TaxID=217475 RepID=UPI0025ACDB74|nr:ATP-dependent zinc metalloprotease FTSH 3, mitochondrial-like isoform X1 [Arachis stenosperma]